MRSVHRLLARVFAAVMCILGAAAASALDEAEMHRLMESRICPKDLDKYQTVKYREHCGENYLKDMSLRDGIKCQNEVDKINKTIWNYNDWISECRRVVRQRYR